MDGIFGNLIKALAEVWNNIGIAQKVSIAITALATIGICAGVLYFGTRPDWQILYADLDPKVAAKVYDIVSAASVQVKLTNSGQTIMVPSKDVYKMRLKVAGEGIQTSSMGSEGWETFDKLPLGATDLQQQLAKQRALQGELEKMINEMPGVAGSRVMLTMPAKSVFKKDKLRPTASIMLNMRQGAVATPQEVNGIRCLIASSVSGMTPDDVTITDNHGNLLARQESEDGALAGDNSKFMEMQSRTERILKEKAEAILRPIVGPENVVAMVSCELDNNLVDTIKEDYNPDGAVVVTEKTVNESLQKNGGGNAGGQVGSAGNLNGPNSQAVDVNNPARPVGEEKSTNDSKTMSEKSYLVPKTVQKISARPGKIKKITVAVTVSKKADGKSWSPEERASFESLVNAAVGSSLYQDNVAGAAGGQPATNVTVKEMDFFKSDKPEYKESLLEKLGDGINALSASNVVRPLLGLALLAVLLVVFKSHFGKGAPESEMGSANAVFSEEVRQLPTEASGGTTALEKQADISPIMDALQAKASASPQTVATLMENWLSQDQG